MYLIKDNQNLEHLKCDQVKEVQDKTKTLKNIKEACRGRHSHDQRTPIKSHTLTKIDELINEKISFSRTPSENHVLHEKNFDHLDNVDQIFV